MTLGQETAPTFNYTIQDHIFSARHYVGGDKARILMYPDWEGCHTHWAQKISADYAKTCQAEVILTDHYGKDNVKLSFDDAYQLNQALLTDPATARPIFKKMVQAIEPVWKSSGPIIVVGFCSGGSFALETGRSGADVDAVFCVHGNPQTPDPLEPKLAPASTADQSKMPIFLTVSGAEDPLITPQQHLEFEKEMRSADVRWSLHYISGAKHSFTRFDAHSSNRAVGYSRRADVETRYLINAQINALREMKET